MVRPKKHLGQHFLTDQNIAQKIVHSLNYSLDLNLLEIGPGKGVLTQYLLKQDLCKLKLVDLDEESIAYLKEHFPEGCEILHADVLKLDWNGLFKGNNFSVIGNFPYNISSQILFKMLEHQDIVDELVGMFQKEMAQRVSAAHGNKEYGVLSVLVQTYYDVEYLFTVNEGVFFPPPKVKSGVIRLKRKEKLPENLPYNAFKNTVKLAFNQRRKQLKNSLRSILPEGFDSDILLKRPEALSVEELIQLHRDLSSASSKQD